MVNEEVASASATGLSLSQTVAKVWQASISFTRKARALNPTVTLSAHLHEPYYVSRQRETLSSLLGFDYVLATRQERKNQFGVDGVFAGEEAERERVLLIPPLNYDWKLAEAEESIARLARSLAYLCPLTAICQDENRRVRAHVVLCASTTDSRPATSVLLPSPATTDSAFSSQQPFNYSPAK